MLIRYNVFSKEMQKSHGFSDVRKRGLSKPVSVNQVSDICELFIDILKAYYIF